MEPQCEVGEDFTNNLVHLAILNPTMAAFSDFGEDLDRDGSMDDLPITQDHVSQQKRAKSRVLGGGELKIDYYLNDWQRGDSIMLCSDGIADKTMV
ncbi:MAG: hypothetical protein JKY48_13090 [Flavobacteriales bacterium]|nr:hypothetical protein [Flavobacteriales bacterium]